MCLQKFIFEVKSLPSKWYPCPMLLHLWTAQLMWFETQSLASLIVPFRVKVSLRFESSCFNFFPTRGWVRTDISVGVATHLGTSEETNQGNFFVSGGSRFESSRLSFEGQLFFRKLLEVSSSPFGCLKPRLLLADDPLAPCSGILM